MLRLPALCVAAATALVAQAQPADAPPVFSKLTFSEAVKQTDGTGKVLIVKATAEWCAPCKRMDKTTWRDEQVVAWFRGNGLAVQFDVDADQSLAQSLKIEAMPTMIAFRNGKEFDRIVGYRSATDLLAWTAGVKRGERDIEMAENRPRRSPDAELHERSGLAKKLMWEGEWDRASEEYVWLWNNGAGSGMSAVRSSFWAGDMRELAGKSPAAMERFVALRDETALRLKAEKIDTDDLDDWMVLNEVVGQDDATLEWFDKVKDDWRWQQALQRVAHQLERLLEKRERWQDLADLYGNPLTQIDDAEQMRSMMAEAAARRGKDAGTAGAAVRKGRDARLAEDAARMFRNTAVKTYTVMLRVGREEDAQAVADKALMFDNTPALREALIEGALRADQPRAHQLTILDEGGRATDASGGLREVLRAALDKK